MMSYIYSFEKRFFLQIYVHMTMHILIILDSDPVTEQIDPIEMRALLQFIFHDAYLLKYLTISVTCNYIHLVYT